MNGDRQFQVSPEFAYEGDVNFNAEVTMYQQPADYANHDPFASFVSDPYGSGSLNGFSMDNFPIMFHLDGYVEVSFEEHERPLGIAMCWDYPLPRVHQILPNTPASMRPGIVPGLELIAINGYSIPPWTSRVDIESQLQVRPIVLGFDVPQGQDARNFRPRQETPVSACRAPKGSPISAYRIGETYRALAALLVRESEDLQSKVVAKAGSGAVVEILEYGIGETMRRLKIFSGGITGWISCQTPAGILLLCTSPAEMSEVDASEGVDKRHSRPSTSGPIMASNLERTARHNMLIETARDRGKQPKDPDGESDPGEERSRRRRKRKVPSLLRRSMTYMTQAIQSGGTQGDLLNSDEPESESDEEVPEEETAEFKAKLVRQQLQCLETRRDKAIIKLNIPDYDMEPEPFFARLQRILGITELRIQIEIKRFKIEEEGPDYEEVHVIASDLRFEVFIGFLILLNGICIALETFHDPEDPDSFPAYLNIAEHVFTFCFLVEFFIRIIAFSWIWIFNLMNMFDIFLVWVTGVLVMWVLMPAGVDAAILRRLGALRILRLARICKAVRIMPFFKELWTLVQGIIECTSLLTWILIIGLVVHYTFAVAMLELVAKDPKFEDDAEVQRLFGGVASAMFTLFQIMTFDTWAGKVKPVVKKDPKAAVVFFLFIGLAGIVLFNLMTAVVVRNAFDAADRDAEAVARAKATEETKTRTELKDMFTDLDEDMSGALSIEEFLECLDDFNFIRKMKLLDIDLEELPDIFEILDDGDGQVDQDEFINGMMRMQGPAMSGEMLKATCSMRTQNLHFVALEDAFVQTALETFRGVDGHVERLHDNMNDMIQLTAEMVRKLDIIGIRDVVKGSIGQMPFLMDPAVEDLHRQERIKKRKAAQKEKARQEAEEEGRTLPPDEQEELRNLPPESFVKKIVPAEWIIRNGRSPLAKNPGKVKLVKDRSLKEKLISGKPKKKAIAPAGVSKSFGRAWEYLNMPLTEAGTLDQQAVTEQHGELPEPPPRAAEGLFPWLMPPNERPAEPEESADPLADLGVPMKAAAQVQPADSQFASADAAKDNMSLTPQVAKASALPPPSHPHAVP